jgi:hypothetical protein
MTRILPVAFLCACASATDTRPPGDSDPGGDSFAGPKIGHGVEMQLATTTVAGELVAIYDHSTWWHDASDELTYALFRYADLLPYPNDTSIALVSSYDIVSMAPAPVADVSYRDALRAHGIVIETLPLADVSYAITGNESYHLDEDGFGNFAWDFELTDENGFWHTGTGWQNTEYLVWDAEVFLPTGGTVIDVVRDAPDNQPGTYEDNATNNMVGVHLYGEYYLYLLHFRQDTIPLAIEPGVVLAAGDYLGRVGNSGVTLEPHLHMTVLWFDAEAGRSWSVPSEFVGVHGSRSPGGPSTPADYMVPESGTWLAEDAW